MRNTAGCCKIIDTFRSAVHVYLTYPFVLS